MNLMKQNVEVEVMVQQGNSMKLASHNSWSYLPVTKWWMRPLNLIAKCQNKSIALQYVDGVGCFDLRVRWDNENYIFVLCHGIVTYQNIDNHMVDLQFLNLMSKTQNGPVYVRVLLEDSGKANRRVDDEFYKLCKKLEEEFPSIMFFGGFPARKRWREYLYIFKTKEPSIDERHVSVSGKWWQFVPKRWAKKNNENVRIIKEEVETIKSDFLMLDFI